MLGYHVAVTLLVLVLSAYWRRPGFQSLFLLPTVTTELWRRQRPKPRTVAM